jgi:hypothetical protein
MTMSREVLQRLRNHASDQRQVGKLDGLFRRGIVVHQAREAAWLGVDDAREGH